MRREIGSDLNAVSLVSRPRKLIIFFEAFSFGGTDSCHDPRQDISTHKMALELHLPVPYSQGGHYERRRRRSTQGSTMVLVLVTKGIMPSTVWTVLLALLTIGACSGLAVNKNSNLFPLPTIFPQPKSRSPSVDEGRALLKALNMTSNTEPKRFVCSIKWLPVIVTAIPPVRRQELAFQGNITFVM